MYSIIKFGIFFRIILIVLFCTVTVLWPGKGVIAAITVSAIEKNAEMKVSTLLADLSCMDEYIELGESNLKELRGGYDSYYFTLDIGVNMTGSTPSVNVQFLAQLPEGSTKPSFSGNSVNFNNGDVSFQAGMGNNSLGTGFYQVISVAGNDNIIIANTNITINVEKMGNLAIPNATNALNARQLQTKQMLGSLR
ncbi:MAG: hypothetical protein ABFD50_19585 [Smithella sp.]